MTEHYDIIIVGAGLVGASLACALQPLPLKIALLDAKPLASTTQSLDHLTSQDTRSLVLSDCSKRIFSALNLWAKLAPYTTPIRQIHLSQRGYFGKALLNAADTNQSAFGYVVAADKLSTLLQQQAQKLTHTTVFSPAKVEQIVWHSNHVALQAIDDKGQFTLTTKLIVAADGVHSTLRQLANIEVTTTEYHDAAIACNLTLAQPHCYTAYERFTAEGTFALLPLAGNQAACVLTVDKSELPQQLALSDQDYLKMCQQQFGYRLGKFLALGKRNSYSLLFLHAKQQVKPRFVLLGNSAHTMHPIAAQGFNLGLRDAACLAQVVADCLLQQQDYGNMQVLTHYEQTRQREQQNLLRFTDTLIHAFAMKLFPLPWLRGLSLAGLDLLPFLKQKIARFGMGHFANLPYLALGVGLGLVEQ